jgi:hypothetical protein
LPQLLNVSDPVTGVLGLELVALTSVECDDEERKTEAFTPEAPKASVPLDGSDIAHGNLDSRDRAWELHGSAS